VYTKEGIYLGLAGEQRLILPLNMANRHGLIAGASGTGKTVTMKVMAEDFSAAGVPVFLCDIKGDVSGLCEPGVSSEGMEKRIDRFMIRDEFSYRSFPVCFWDVYQQRGRSVRATVSDMGPELLGRVLGLSEVQTGVLNILFRIADESGLELIDLKDLRAMLEHITENRAELSAKYGNMSAQSISSIIRALIPLENQGGELFFGEPALDIHDWIRRDATGHGYINLLRCERLAQSPVLYATFMLWLMSELFEVLPEVGDMDKPKLVFFFDEAHMLFTDAPRTLVQKIEQMVKLIRSKGVGVYFVTQSPSDIPDPVLAQLSHRVQHALRAYTPAEQKAVRAAVQSMRANPDFDAAKVMLELGVGQALVSLLGPDGVPGIVQRTAIICPQSKMAPAEEQYEAAARASDGMEKYDNYVDNESAFEKLARQKDIDAERQALEAERAQLEKEKAELEAKKQKEEAKAAAAAEKASQRRRAQIERQLINTGAQVLKRGLLSTLLGKRR